jgi:hypothetical protein
MQVAQSVKWLDTGWMMFDSRQGSCIVSSPPPHPDRFRGSTQLPTYLVPEFLSERWNECSAKLTTYLHLAPKLKTPEAFTSSPPIHIRNTVLRHRYKCTFALYLHLLSSLPFWPWSVGLNLATALRKYISAALILVISYYFFIFIFSFYHCSFTYERGLSQQWRM